MTIVVSDDQDDPLPPIDIEALAKLVLDGEAMPATTEVAIAFVAEPAIAELNERHLGKRGPTDVLSFPLEDLTPGVPPGAGAGNGPPLAIGDVLICPAVVQANAVAAGVPLADEMALMVVHGLLHLLGYDHVADDDAELMESQERRYLALVGRTRP